ncbi:MAG: hypothetical protein EPN20_03545 [Magnetospirillum sp.]|nr:MAG: hypothetical protein EPN20_03545 [Magnetospirillum sp.]
MIDQMSLPTADSVVFRKRPRPVPGDLRIAWRLTVVILILGYCQKNKASLPKLHLLSNALKDSESMDRLSRILDGSLSVMAWKVSVEPALGRALDLARGEKLVVFESNASYRLSDKGEATLRMVMGDDLVLTEQKAFLLKYAKSITNTFINKLVRVQAGAAP